MVKMNISKCDVSYVTVHSVVFGHPQFPRYTNTRSNRPLLLKKGNILNAV